MGNISLGYVRTETSSKKVLMQQQVQVNMDIFGVGYNLGGGVMFEVAHGNKEETDGADSLKDTEADVTLAKISFGF